MTYTLRGFGEMLATRSLLAGSKIALPSGSRFHVVGRDMTVMHRTIDHLTTADLVEDQNVFEYPGLRDVVVLESSAICKVRRSIQVEVIDGTGRVETLPADTVINTFGSMATGSMPTGGGWVHVAYIAPGSTYAFVDVTRTPVCGENEEVDPATGRCVPTEVQQELPPIGSVCQKAEGQTGNVYVTAEGRVCLTPEELDALPAAGKVCTTDVGQPGHFVAQTGGVLHCNPDPHPSKWYADRRLWIAVGVAAGTGLLYGVYRWDKGRRK
jgi:hypothetical protein